MFRTLLGLGLGLGLVGPGLGLGLVALGLGLGLVSSGLGLGLVGMVSFNITGRLQKATIPKTVLFIHWRTKHTAGPRLLTYFGPSYTHLRIN
jgi:hypothetical protein